MNYEYRIISLKLSQWAALLLIAVHRRFIISRSSVRIFLLLTSVFCLLTPAFAGTHVTGVYSVGASPAVMATVNGNSEYGLVFAQRNMTVTYNNIIYNNNVVTAYFDVNGNLNEDRKSVV